GTDGGAGGRCRIEPAVLGEERSPADDAGWRASRRSTCGFWAIPGRASRRGLLDLVRQPAPGSQLIVAGGRSPGPPESEGTSLGRGSRAADPAYRRVPAPRTLGSHLRPRILGPLHL